MEARVRDLKEQLGRGPSALQRLRFDIAISWNAAAVIKGLPYGKMVLVSPHETMDAVLWQCSERLGSDDIMEDEVKEWLRVIRSSKFNFLKLDSDDAKYFHSLQMREDKKAEAQALDLNVLQQCLDVWVFKKRKEIITNIIIGSEQVARLYEAHIKFAQGSQQRSAGIRWFRKHIINVNINVSSVTLCPLSFRSFFLP